MDPFVAARRIVFVTDHAWIANELQRLCAPDKAAHGGTTLALGHNLSADSRARAWLDPDNALPQVDLRAPDSVAAVAGPDDLVILVHARQVVTAPVCEKRYLLNVHPGVLPETRGMYPHVFAMIHGLPVGFTVHRVTAEIDAGPIIHQETTTVCEHETGRDVYQRIIALEVSWLRDNIERLRRGEFSEALPAIDRQSHYFSYADFEAICRIDPEEVTTARALLRYLRALSHEPYWNTYMPGPDGVPIQVRVATRRSGDD